MLDPEERVLLFRFLPPAGEPFWATPGGAVDPGETYKEAARRELLEETGLDADVGAEVARRQIEFITIEGEPVTADERYFLVRVNDGTISRDGHTELERRVMGEHLWWGRDALAASLETIFPEDIADLLDRVLAAGEA